MIFFPAIDLKEGRCVRLEKGDMARATVYGDDPADQARRFEDAGCAWIHVVDLDGAVGGGSPNADAVGAILDATGLRVQLGGGIRDRAAADGWIARGAARIVLGTLPVRDPALAGEICRAHGGRVAFAADASGGRLRVEGWVEETGESVDAFARSAGELGAAALIRTDIDADGMLGGVDADAVAAFARASPVPVVASGGVAGPGDLGALADRDARARAEGAPGIEGVIVGRAVYEGRVDPAEAVRLLGG